jgi:hypothetical protein
VATGFGRHTQLPTLVAGIRIAAMIEGKPSASCSSLSA